MGFIVENYMIFLVIGVLIIMALIGFIAEKTNFGKGNGKKNTTNNNLKNDSSNNVATNQPQDVQTNNAESININQPVLEDSSEFNVIPDLNLAASVDASAPVEPDPLQTPDINNNDLYAGLDTFGVAAPVVDNNGLNQDQKIDSEIAGNDINTEQNVENVEPPISESAIETNILTDLNQGIPEASVNQDALAGIVPETNPEQTVGINEIPEIVAQAEVVDLKNEDIPNIEVVQQVSDEAAPNVNPAEGEEPTEEDIWKF